MLRRFYTVDGLKATEDGQRDVVTGGPDYKTKRDAISGMKSLAARHPVDVFKLQRWALRDPERAYKGFRITETETWELSETGKLERIDA